jgi:serine/threonine protein phosphatase PrpC
MSAAFEKWMSAPAPIKDPKKEIRRAEFRLIESAESDSRLQIGLATEASPDHPDRNEDSYRIYESRGLDVLNDGVGGGLAGNLASACAAQELSLERLATRDPMTRLVMEAKRDEPIASSEDVENAVRQTLVYMQEAITALQIDPSIIAIAKKKAEVQLKHRLDIDDPMDRQAVLSYARSMGTTASLSKIWRDTEGKDHVTVGNVGDSRIYRLRQGRLERLTPDHSIVQSVIDHRLNDTDGHPIEDDQDINRKVPIKEVEKHQKTDTVLRSLYGLMKSEKMDAISIDDIRHYVIQIIGSPSDNKHYAGETLKPFIKTDALEDGDIFLSCSDGLSDVLTDNEIQAILLKHADQPFEAAKALEIAASDRSKTNHQRAKPDDVTVIVKRYQRDKKSS